MKKMIYRVFLLIVIGIFLFNGGKLAVYLYDGYVTDKLNKRLQQQYELLAGEMTESSSKDLGRLNPEEEYQHRFQSLQQMNNDVKGWIQIEGTKVAYPILQSTDNDYYLNHNIEHKKSARGSIFMDYRNTSPAEDRHTVIYGHHMKDGSMFGELSNYKEFEYYQFHQTISLHMIDKASEWQIFSVYIYSPEDQSFQYEFADDREYNHYLTTISNQSKYETGIVVNSKDQLLTLVTCTYEVTDARLIIHAKRIK